MIILLNGAIASGKTSIGALLEKTLQEQGHAVSRYDLDDEVKKIKTDMVWKDKEKQLTDWLQARKKLAEKAEKEVQQKRIVVVSGPFFTRDEINGLLDYIANDIPVFLFTLHVSIEQRITREKLRNKNVFSVIMNQEQLLAELLEKFGVVVENMCEPGITVMTILQLIKNKEGLLERTSLH